MTINERVSPERLDTIKSWREKYGQDANVMIPASEAESIISELQQYRASEPVVSDSMALAFHAAITDSAAGTDDIDEIKIGLRAALANYTAPQVTSVPDERYRQLSDLYHAQEKRLFKLAQRIKGPAFDKYAYSPSQAIDVLESAIFGERDEGWNACRAAMLAAPAAQAEQTKRLIGWRTTDYTEETSDPEMAKNWAAAVGVLPIFEGDINTRIQAEQLSGNTEQVEPVSQPYTLPDGYALVPVEPTDEMIAAALDCDGVNFDKADGTVFYVNHRTIYAAMLAAAPQQEAE